MRTWEPAGRRGHECQQTPWPLGPRPVSAGARCCNCSRCRSCSAHLGPRTGPRPRLADWTSARRPRQRPEPPLPQVGPARSAAAGVAAPGATERARVGSIRAAMAPHFRVVAPDARGFRDSEWSRSYAPDDRPADLDGALAAPQLGKRSSAGTRDRVSKLILVDTGLASLRRMPRPTLQPRGPRVLRSEENAGRPCRVEVTSGVAYVG